MLDDRREDTQALLHHQSRSSEQVALKVVAARGHVWFLVRKEEEWMRLDSGHDARVMGCVGTHCVLAVVGMSERCHVQHMSLDESVSSE